jgi:hypothetical protein
VPFQPSQKIDEKRALTVTARVFAVIAMKLVEMEKHENWVPEKYVQTRETKSFYYVFPW